MKNLLLGILFVGIAVFSLSGCNNDIIENVKDKYNETTSEKPEAQQDTPIQEEVISSGTILYEDGSTMGVTKIETPVNGGFQVYHIGTGEVIGFIGMDGVVNNLGGVDLGVCNGTEVTDQGMSGDCTLSIRNPEIPEEEIATETQVEVISTGTVLYKDGSTMGVTKMETPVNGGFQVYQTGTGEVRGFIRMNGAVNNFGGVDLGVCSGAKITDQGMSGNCTLSVNNPAAIKPPTTATPPAGTSQVLGSTNIVTTKGKTIKVDRTAGGFIFHGYEGKIVLLEVYGDTCPHCVDAIPAYNRLQAKYPDDVVIIALESYGSLNNAGRQQYITIPKAKTGSMFSFIQSLTGYNRQAVPYLMIFDRNGNKVYNKILANFPENDIDNRIQQLL